ncbi:unnamed protein product [Schistosoma margrebowiei]|uniref:Uncharacterized protein n=1 Tax=Schistosoma margrebowiei TaxID=48269 RepID=A0A3P8BMA5_9TREM|nr:unnamed protein product [Schistosoma margrebowiei]
MEESESTGDLAKKEDSKVKEQEEMTQSVTNIQKSK